MNNGITVLAAIYPACFRHGMLLIAWAVQGLHVAELVNSLTSQTVLYTTWVVAMLLVLLFNILKMSINLPCILEMQEGINC